MLLSSGLKTYPGVPKKIVRDYRFCCRTWLSHLTQVFLAAYPLQAFPTSSLLSVPHSTWALCQMIQHLSWKREGITQPYPGKSQLFTGQDLNSPVQGAASSGQLLSPSQEAAGAEHQLHSTPPGTAEKCLCWYVKYSPVLPIFSWVSTFIIPQGVLNVFYLPPYLHIQPKIWK